MEGGVGEREVDILGAMIDEQFHWREEMKLFGRQFLSMEERGRYGVLFGRNLGAWRCTSVEYPFIKNH